MIGSNASRQIANQLRDQVIGRIATCLLAAVLIVAWALTGPLFYLANSLSENWKRKKSAMIKENYE